MQTYLGTQIEVFSKKQASTYNQIRCEVPDESVRDLLYDRADTDEITSLTQYPYSLDEEMHDMDDSMDTTYENSEI